MSEWLSACYLASNGAADLCYVPQLALLIRRPDAARGLSVATWLGWSVTSAVSFLYLLENVNQWPVLLIAGTNMLFQWLVCLCIFRALLSGRGSR